MGDDDVDYYAVLGLARECGADEIKRAYRKLAVVNHPDKGGDKETFQLISEAYAVLSDPQKRSTYDSYGGAGVRFEESSGHAAGGSAPGASARRAHQQQPDFGGPRHFHPHVSFGFAENLFRDFFGDGRHHDVAPGFGVSPFGSLFGGGFFGGGGLFGGDGFGAFGRDPFGPALAFPAPLGAGGFAFSSSSSSTFGSGGGGTSTSVQSTTTTENGQRVTRTTRTVRHADGREETTSDVRTEPLHIDDSHHGGSSYYSGGTSIPVSYAARPLAPAALPPRLSYENGAAAVPAAASAATRPVLPSMASASVHPHSTRAAAEYIDPPGAAAPPRMPHREAERPTGTRQQSAAPPRAVPSYAESVSSASSLRATPPLYEREVPSSSYRDDTAYEERLRQHRHGHSGSSRKLGRQSSFPHQASVAAAGGDYPSPAREYSASPGPAATDYLRTAARHSTRVPRIPSAARSRY